ncbi:NUDIX domain-containing protein [Mycolicibacterium sarraceniae]|uniref:NUDIX domain-containing protein n=1 Tax=Mycolicibacterium sarraceniae TaxID=1534348 RepID=UPI003898F6CB
MDTALLTLDPADPELMVLQVRRADAPGWGLPGTFLRPGERLADAVERSLQTKADVRGVRPRQLHVYDDPARDSRGWGMSAIAMPSNPTPATCSGGSSPSVSCTGSTKRSPAVRFSATGSAG